MTRKESERQRTRNVEGLMRHFFEESSDGILLLDSKGAIVDSNPAACELFGCCREELDDRLLFSLVRTDVGLDAIWTDLSAGDRASGDLAIEMPDGARRTIRWRLTYDVVPWMSVMFLRP